MYTVSLVFITVEIRPYSRENFTVPNITGSLHLHTRCPYNCDSHKNIHSISFYREVSHFSSTYTKYLPCFKIPGRSCTQNRVVPLL